MFLYFNFFRAGRHLTWHCLIGSIFSLSENNGTLGQVKLGNEYGCINVHAGAHPCLSFRDAVHAHSAI